MRYDDILATVGRTPVVRLNKVHDTLAGALWVKLESFNPGGSVKDRPALNMIEDAEWRGVLTPDMTIVEPTSGNTGIGLAMVAAVKGYRAVFVMAEDMSEERKRILAAYGAEIVLTPADRGTVGAIEEARRLEQEKGYFFVGQHYNPANPESHRRTADEIFDDFGVDLDVLVCTTGTGGTISGLSTWLRDRIPGLRIVATEPADSPILSKGDRLQAQDHGNRAGLHPRYPRHRELRRDRADHHRSRLPRRPLSRREGRHVRRHLLRGGSGRHARGSPARGVTGQDPARDPPGYGRTLSQHRSLELKESGRTGTGAQTGFATGVQRCSLAPDPPVTILRIVEGRGGGRDAVDPGVFSALRLRVAKRPPGPSAYAPMYTPQRLHMRNSAVCSPNR